MKHEKPEVKKFKVNPGTTMYLLRSFNVYPEINDTEKERNYKEGIRQLISSTMAAEGLKDQKILVCDIINSKNADFKVPFIERSYLDWLNNVYNPQPYQNESTEDYFQKAGFLDVILHLESLHNNSLESKNIRE